MEAIDFIHANSEEIVPLLIAEPGSTFQKHVLKLMGSQWH
jgi:hypothetical protein